MQCELDKIDIINLIRGVEPSYETMNSYLGRYSASYDRWTWNDVNDKCWNKLNEKELFEYYNKIKESLKF